MSYVMMEESLFRSLIGRIEPDNNINYRFSETVY